MHTLKAWQARRAGATITVTGRDPVDGSDSKITGIVYIEPRNYGANIVAVHKDGSETELVA